MLPYTVASVTRDERVDDDDPFRDPTDPALSVGADLKYGVTSNLTLTATFNPDFGQVEADPSQVNLSAFETFFQERRPFFVEGVDVFNFGLGGGEALFYSRRIGRTPQGGVGNGNRFVDAPDATTILGAAKLTGRTSGGWTIGVLDAVTAEEKTRYVIDDVDGVQRAVTEPMTNYGVARVRRDLRQGQTSIGGIVTTVHRRLGDNGLEWLPGSAYAGGFDWRHRFMGGAWQFNGFLLQSTVRGDTLAIQRLQLSPARLFQRPDADHVEYDSRRTALTGTGGLIALNKIAGRWQTGSGLVYRSPGFETNDIGFLQSADFYAWDAYVGYNQFEPRGPFRTWSLYHAHDAGWTTDGERTRYSANLTSDFSLLNLWTGYWGVSHSTAGLSVSDLRGGPAIVTAPSSDVWGGFASDRRKKLSWGADLSTEWESGTDGGSVAVAPFVNVRPSSRFDLSLAPSLNWNREAWQYVGARADATAGGTRRWVFGRLDQRTVSLTARLNYIFSPFPVAAALRTAVHQRGRLRGVHGGGRPARGRVRRPLSPAAGGGDPRVHGRGWRGDLRGAPAGGGMRRDDGVQLPVRQPGLQRAAAEQQRGAAVGVPAGKHAVRGVEPGARGLCAGWALSPARQHVGPVRRAGDERAADQDELLAGLLGNREQGTGNRE